jgi:hypothetical protein
MGRTLQYIRGQLRWALFFIPFTFYFLLFSVAGVLVYNWLLSNNTQPGSSFADIFTLLLKAAVWFVAVIVGVAIISSLLAYLVFVWRMKKNNIQFSIQSKAAAANNGNKPTQRIIIAIAPLLKPLLGFIKLRLQYDDKQFSPKFALVQQQQKKLFSSQYMGEYQWQLPEIKEYRIEKLVLYFEDMFQFFSFTIALPVSNRFYTSPFAPVVANMPVSPRKTEESATRIEELKKVEGEYLNYKNFENNDDVRRIVWKIYAKNKELVVRTPEVLDPTASHAYIYTSFYTAFDIAGNSTAEIFFLNYYKTMLWGVYQQLGKQGFALRLVADQPTPTLPNAAEQDQVQYALSTSKWQADKNITQLAGAKDASVIIVSSFCHADDIAVLLNNQSAYTTIVFVKLSNSLQSTYLIQLVQWLFIQQEKNEVEMYKTNWRLSLLRKTILDNEHKLETLLGKHSRTVVL